jgi:hypothetical protein
MVALARAAGEGETRGKTRGVASLLAPAARWRHGHAIGRQEAKEEREGEGDGT